MHHRCESSCKKEAKKACTAKSIRQCHLKKNEGTYVITKPGNYALSENIQGTIVIAASPVCLDLCCHTINAEGRPSAITVQGTIAPDQIVPDSVLGKAFVVPNPQKVDIKNKETKSVKRPLVSKVVAEKEDSTNIFSFQKDLVEYKIQDEPHLDAFSKQEGKNFKTEAYKVHKIVKANVSNSTICQVKIFNGCITGASNAAVLINQSYDVSLYDLTFNANTATAVSVQNTNVVKLRNIDFFGPIGGTALTVINSDNIFVNDVNVTAFQNDQTPLLQFLSCNNTKLNTVNVTNNTKTLSADVENGNPAAAFVYFSSSQNIKVKGLKLNNNIVLGNLALLETRFQPLSFVDCTNSILIESEVNSNLDTGAKRQSFIFLLRSSNFFISQVKVNGNSSTTQNAQQFRVIHGVGSSNVLIHECQISANTSTGTVNQSIVFLVDEEFPAEFSNFEVSKCYISGQMGRVISAITFLAPTGLFVNQININNNIIENLSGTEVIGILLARARHYHIDSCKIANLQISGSDAAVGVFVNRGDPGLINKCVIQNILQESGISTTFHGIFFVGSQNMTCKNCDVSKLTSQGSVTGISVSPSTTEILFNSRNVIVKKCNISNLSTSGTLAAHQCIGISVNALNSVVKECNVLNLLSNVSTDGILIIRPIEGTFNTVIQQCNILDIVAESDASIANGISLTRITNATIRDCNIIDVRAGASATGIFLGSSSNATVLNNSITRLDATAICYGLVAQISPNLTARENVIKDIFATRQSGGIGVLVSSPNCNISDNEVSTVSVASGFITGAFISASNNTTLLRNLATNSTIGYLIATVGGSGQSGTLLQDNIANNNMSFGYQENLLGSTNYIGNVAQLNGVDYGPVITPVIPLQTLSAGNFTNVTGNAALGARFVNLSIL